MLDEMKGDENKNEWDLEMTERDRGMGGKEVFINKTSELDGEDMGGNSSRV